MDPSPELDPLVRSWQQSEVKTISEFQTLCPQNVDHQCPLLLIQTRETPSADHQISGWDRNPIWKSLSKTIRAFHPRYETFHFLWVEAKSRLHLDELRIPVIQNYPQLSMLSIKQGHFRIFGNTAASKHIHGKTFSLYRPLEVLEWFQHFDMSSVSKRRFYTSVKPKQFVEVSHHAQSIIA